MFADERREKIEQYILNHGAATVLELSEIYNVSEVTIRKDLDELSRIGQISRTHGGAVTKYHTREDLRIRDLSIRHPQEKKRIAAKALEYIENGDSIILDMSTTTLALALLINDCAVKDLTVVTPSIVISRALSREDINVILLGGYLNKKMDAVTGPITQNQIRSLNVDKAFVGTDGVDPEYGISTGSFDDAAVKIAMRESSKRFYILTDHSKFHKRFMARIMKLEEIDIIITDRREDWDYSSYEKRTDLIFADS